MASSTVIEWRSGVARPGAEILFLSHCVPSPPDKGERIRCFHLLRELTGRFRVHVACFARQRQEMEHALDEKDRCASIYAEHLPFAPTLARAGLRFGLGDSIIAAFYSSRRMAAHIAELRGRISAAVVFSSAMARLAPERIPMLLDMVDVDSEKWAEYGRMRWPGLLYATEARRLRRIEARAGAQAVCTYLTTEAEKGQLAGIAPGAAIRCVENGVDFDCFKPAWPVPINLARRYYVAFVGVMDYFPNVDGCRWFAGEVFPELRKRLSTIEFLIVGRNPAAAVRRLAGVPGITVTGGVPDVRPYLAGAAAVVAPLRIARGIQNKVLEALAMGKRVFASAAVARTFGEKRPAGMVTCATAEEFVEAMWRSGLEIDRSVEIGSAVRRRFSWEENMRTIGDDVERAVASGGRSGL